MTTDVVVKVLAVVGGGVLGGLGLGLVAQLLARAVTAKKLPRKPVLLVRLLSGLICGWLIALCLFGGGGSGIGGLGGWNFGSGSGKGDGEKTNEVVHKDGEDKKGGEPKTPAEETLRIEVLGDDTLKNKGRDMAHRYRVETGELLTIDEVKKAIQERQKNKPPLHHIEIVLYEDSPNEDVPFVSDLKVWARDRDVKVDILKSSNDVPRK